MSPTELERVLEHARTRTEALLEPLDDEQLTLQVSPLQSPLVWDLAHIGYFEELWLLRHAAGREPLSAAYDDLYDSFAHGRAERGDLPILEPAAARAYVDEVRDAVVELLPELASGDFLVGMVAQHELQHGETMAQTLALAGWLPECPPGVTASGDVLIEGGPFTLGSDEPWAYDNERPARVVDLAPFRIDPGSSRTRSTRSSRERTTAPTTLPYSTSRSTRPTHTRAGRASACRPSPSGRRR